MDPTTRSSIETNQITVRKPPGRSDEDAARLSPLIDTHLNVHGRYTFTQPAGDELRPLRNLAEPAEDEYLPRWNFAGFLTGRAPPSAALSTNGRLSTDSATGFRQAGPPCRQLASEINVGKRWRQ